MQTWWALVRTDGGGAMRVTVQAPNAYQAFQMLKGMYGNMLISEYASLQV